MHAELGAADHQGVCHIVAAVAEEHELAALQAAEVLADRQHIRQDLRGMEFVRQAVPDGDAGVFCQLLHDALAEAAVFDAVIQAAEHAGRVSNGFLFADLGAGRVEISNVHAEVVRGHLKGAARAGRGLLKDQRDVLPAECVVRDAGLLFGLQGGGEVEQTGDLVGGEVQQGQKAFTV